MDLGATVEDDLPLESASPPLPPPPAPPVERDVDDVPPAAPARRMPTWLPLVIVLAVVALAVGAFLVLNKDDDETAAPGTSTTTAADTEFVTVRDDEAGFTVSHPKNWVSLRPGEGEERLLVSAGGQNYFQLKVRNIDPAVVDQQIVEGLKDVRMVTEPRQFTLNGLSTYYFLYYTPVTEESPTEGVHAHYFIKNGDRLYTMVFQALPTDGFTDLAPTFDRVAESFQVTAPAAAATTAPAPASSSTSAP